MNLLDVYSRYDIEPVKGKGCYVWDKEGSIFLDFYGGHGVISIGHSHPYYVEKISDQLDKLGFYSNAVRISVQEQLAQKLGEVSGCADYSLFLCNSGAEANENALKLASFHTGRKRVIAFEGAFHGRTSLAVSTTDNASIRAPVNESSNVIRLPFNDPGVFLQVMDESIACVIIEGIQGIAGVHEPTKEFLELLEAQCREVGALLILDEVQSGYGRTGKFFSYQYAGISPDLVTTAKGMGNGFPIGGVLVAPHIKTWKGMLGTTFGGNHLACAAALAVLEIMEKEQLITNAKSAGGELMEQVMALPKVKNVKGKGLMIGVELADEAKPYQKRLLANHHVFTGSASEPRTLRLLPPLSISHKESEQFLSAFQAVLNY